MIRCESIQDQMPLVASGGAEWSPEEAAHLEQCSECRAERTLIQTARRLGDSAVTRVDPAQVAAAVRDRLAAERRAARWRRGGWLAGLAAAAAIALVVWGRPTDPGDRPETRPVAAANQPLRVPLAELERLDAGQLESVLDGLDEPIGAGSVPDVPHLGDLDGHQLERVLRSLEG